MTAGETRRNTTAARGPAPARGGVLCLEHARGNFRARERPAARRMAAHDLAKLVASVKAELAQLAEASSYPSGEGPS